MKRIIYVLVFMIGFAGLFTSCIDNVEPIGLQDLRSAKADYYRALAELQKANAGAATTLAECEKMRAAADAAYQNAQAQLILANANYVEAQKALVEAQIAALEAETAHNEAMWAIEEEIAALGIKLAEAEVAKANAEAAYEVAKYEALTEVEKAKAKADVAEAEARLAEAQAALRAAELQKAAMEEQYVIDSLKRVAEQEAALAAIEAGKYYNAAAIQAAQTALKEAELANIATIKAGEELLAYAKVFIDGDAMTPAERDLLEGAVGQFNAALANLKKAQIELRWAKSALVKAQYDYMNDIADKEFGYNQAIANDEAAIAKIDGKIADLQAANEALAAAFEESEFFKGVDVLAWKDELDEIVDKLEALDHRKGELFVEIEEAKREGLADYLDYVSAYADYMMEDGTFDPSFSPDKNGNVDFDFTKEVLTFVDAYKKYIVDETLLDAVDAYYDYANNELADAIAALAQAQQDSLDAAHHAMHCTGVVALDSLHLAVAETAIATAQAAQDLYDEYMPKIIESQCLYTVVIDLAKVFQSMYTHNGKNALEQFASYVALLQTAVVAPNYQKGYEIYVENETGNNFEMGTFNCEYFTENKIQIGYLKLVAEDDGSMNVSDFKHFYRDSEGKLHFVDSFGHYIEDAEYIALAEESNSPFPEIGYIGAGDAVPYIMFTNLTYLEEAETPGYFVYKWTGNEGPFLVINTTSDRLEWLFNGGDYEATTLLGNEIKEHNDFGLFGIYNHLTGKEIGDYEATAEYEHLIKDLSQETFDAVIAAENEAFAKDSVKYVTDVNVAKKAYEDAVQAVADNRDDVIADMEKAIADWKKMDSIKNVLDKLKDVKAEAETRYTAWKSSATFTIDVPTFYGDCTKVTNLFADAEHPELVEHETDTWMTPDKNAWKAQADEFQNWFDKYVLEDETHLGDPTSKHSETYLGASGAYWTAVNDWVIAEQEKPRSDGTVWGAVTDTPAIIKTWMVNNPTAYPRPSASSIYNLVKQDNGSGTEVWTVTWMVIGEYDPCQAVWTYIGTQLNALKNIDITQKEWPIFVGDTTPAVTKKELGADMVTYDELLDRIDDVQDELDDAEKDVKKDIADFNEDYKAYWESRGGIYDYEYTVVPDDDYEWRDSDDFMKTGLGDVPAWADYTENKKVPTKFFPAVEPAGAYTLTDLENILIDLKNNGLFTDFELALPSRDDFGHVYFEIVDGDFVTDALMPGDLAQAYYVTLNAQTGSNGTIAAAEKTIGANKQLFSETYAKDNKNIQIDPAWIQYYAAKGEGNSALIYLDTQLADWQLMRIGNLALWFQDNYPNCRMSQDDDNIFYIELNNIYDNAVYFKLLAHQQYIAYITDVFNNYEDYWKRLGDALQGAYDEIKEYVATSKDVAEAISADLITAAIESAEFHKDMIVATLAEDREALEAAIAAWEDAKDALVEAQDNYDAAVAQLDALYKAADAEYDVIKTAHAEKVETLLAEDFANALKRGYLDNLLTWLYTTYNMSADWQLDEEDWPGMTAPAFIDGHETRIPVADFVEFIEAVAQFYQDQIDYNNEKIQSLLENKATAVNKLAEDQAKKDVWDAEQELNAKTEYNDEASEYLNYLQDEVTKAENELKAAQYLFDVAKFQLDATLEALDAPAYDAE